MSDLHEEALDYPTHHREEVLSLLQARERLTDVLAASRPQHVYRKRARALAWGIGITLVGGNLIWIIAAFDLLPDNSWIASLSVISVSLLLLIVYMRVTDIYDRNRRYAEALALIPSRLASLHDDRDAGGSGYIAFLITNPVMRFERKAALVLTCVVLAMGLFFLFSGILFGT